MTWLRDLFDDWWRVDPAGLAMLVGFTLSTLLGALAVTLAVKA